MAQVKKKQKEFFARQKAIEKERRYVALEVARARRKIRSDAFKLNKKKYGTKRAKFIAVYMRDKLYGHGVRPGRAHTGPDASTKCGD